jgi:exonuclease III
MDSMNQSQIYKILPWNVRGLNNSARQEDVRQMVSLVKPEIICLQETKLVTIDRSTVCSTLGSQFADNYFYLPGDGTRGGILVASRDSVFHLHQPHFTHNTISSTMLDNSINKEWTFTGVYGHQGSLEKAMFLRELRTIRHHAKHEWLIMGDFNMIYKAHDKNNSRLNLRLMNKFRRALNWMEVKVVDLMGKNTHGVTTRMCPP